MFGHFYKLGTRQTCAQTKMGLPEKVAGGGFRRWNLTCQGGVTSSFFALLGNYLRPVRWGRMEGCIADKPWSAGPVPCVVSTSSGHLAFTCLPGRPSVRPVFFHSWAQVLILPHFPRWLYPPKGLESEVACHCFLLSEGGIKLSLSGLKSSEGSSLPGPGGREAWHDHRLR